MDTRIDEKIFDLCHDHLDSADLEELCPGYKFNQYINYPSMPCAYKECKTPAYYVMIGIRVPDACGDLSDYKDEESIPLKEIIKEAKSLLDKTTAIDGLTDYFKARLIPHKCREAEASSLLRHLAALTLEKLRIDKDCSLSDKNKLKLLKQLGIIPYDCR